MITAKDLYDNYMKKCGGYLPCDFSVAQKFMKESNNILKKNPSMETLVDLMQDYVGANQYYEEGCEEAW